MSTIIDLTTNHSFVENNGVTIEDNAGKFSGSKALYFDGNSYINFPALAASISNFPACIEAWVKPEINNQSSSDRSGNFNSYGIITKGRPKINSGNNFGLFLHRYSLDHVLMFKSYSSTFENMTSSRFTTSTYTPQWYHIALTISESSSIRTLKMYINGSLVESDSEPITSTNFTSSDQYLTLGAYKSYYNNTYASSNKFKGYMSDVRLTCGEIIYTENFDPPTQPHPKNY